MKKNIFKYLHVGIEINVMYKYDHLYIRLNIFLCFFFRFVSGKSCGKSRRTKNEETRHAKTEWYIVKNIRNEFLYR